MRLRRLAAVSTSFAVYVVACGGDLEPTPEPARTETASARLCFAEAQDIWACTACCERGHEGDLAKGRAAMQAILCGAGPCGAACNGSTVCAEPSNAESAPSPSDACNQCFSDRGSEIFNAHDKACGEGCVAVQACAESNRCSDHVSP